MMKSAEELQDKFDKVFSKAVTKGDMTLVHQADGLKRKIDELRGSIVKVDTSLKGLKKRKIQ